MGKYGYAFLFMGLLASQTGALAAPGSDRITVTVRGQGPDVMLIPGLSCSNAVWEATAKRLENKYRLHLVQVAGFAGAPSQANAHGAVLQPTVGALDAYIRSNKLKSPKVIGHSMGGLMGLMLAQQHPEDVSKLLVVDSLPFFGVLMGASDTAEVEPRAAGLRDMILDQSQEAYTQGQESFLRMLVKSTNGLALATRWAATSDKSVVGHAMYEIMTTDLRPKLKDIKTPVTVLYPWDAAMGRPQAAVDDLYEQSFASLPNKKLVRIEGSFHFIMFDQPEAMAKQVNEFLQ